MPLDSGRKKDGVWSEVKALENDQKKVVCMHCDGLISKKVERIREHMSKCKVKNVNAKSHEDEIQEAAEKLLSPPQSQGSDDSRPQSSMSVNSSTSDMSRSSTPNPMMSKRFRSSSGGMNSFVVRTTVEQKADIDNKLAKYIFSENISFRSVEGEQFLNFCEAMRPGYKPPNRKILASKLLDEVHDQVIAEMKEKIARKEVLVLSQDGWSSVRNDPIIAHSFNDGKYNYLLNIKDTGSEKKTAQFCFQLLDDAIQEIQRDLGKTVFGVCTDNEAKMKSLRQLVKRSYPDILVYGCGAHYANLLEEDVNNTQVLKHVVEIQKYFRNVHKAHGMLKEKGGCMSQLPNATRWNSIVSCLETFIKNYHTYVNIKSDMLQNDEDMPAPISRAVDNIGLLRNAEHFLGHMKKFASALDTLQSDTCHLSDSVHVWNSLLSDKVGRTCSLIGTSAGLNLLSTFFSSDFHNFL